ncbi:hypothetical protein IL306_004969 [Fusarium sp. DS 682]|nr:hypothetical protein IL306_004969 [Fusarium sp. DS 682]
MDYLRQHRKAVYTNAYCRYVFKLPVNSNISKKESIRLAVRNHVVDVAGFSEDKLVEILYYLIGKGVFHSSTAAALEFPDLHDTEIAGAQSPTKPSTEYQPSKMATFDLSWLRHSFDDDTYADLTLVSRVKQYSAHRIIVCPQSPVMAKKFQFKDTTQGPSCDSCGALPKYRFDFLDDDPQAVDCLIQYFYRQDYQSSYRGPATKDTRPDEAEGTNSPSPLDQNSIDDSYPIFHVRVYALAEFYNIPALKELALVKFKRAIQDDSQPDRILDGVEEAYASTIQEDRGLRDAITEFFYTHSNLVSEKRVQDILQTTNSLAYNLFMHWHKNQATPKKAKPPWP